MHSCVAASAAQRIIATNKIIFVALDTFPQLTARAIKTEVIFRYPGTYLFSNQNK